MRNTSNSLFTQATQKLQQPKVFRGGDKKVMKKSLSLLVAIALVFSMFSSMAFAADAPLTTEQKYEALKKAGIFEGSDDGQAHLDKTMNRAQAAKIVALLAGYKEGVAVKDAGYKDLTGYGWAKDFINFASEIGVLEGKGNNKFDPGADVTIQQLATIAVKLLKTADVVLPAGEAVEGEVAEWAAADVAAVVKAGLIAKQDDYTIGALRALLVDVTYAAQAALANAGKLAAEAKQAGVKTVEVKFNKAIDDTKVKFVVKNGAVTRDVTNVTFSADKTTAVLELSTKLLNGASTVTASGVADADVVANFTAADEKITEIKFTGDKVALGTATNNAADYNKVSVGYKIVNQFGEDVTKTSGGTLTFQVSKPGATGTASNGILTINSPAQPFNFNETVFVSAILNLNTYGVTATQTFTVGQQAMVDSVDVLSVYHEGGKKDLMTNSTFSDFYILVDAKDQYGNNVTLQQFKDGVFVVATNPTLFTIDKANAVEKVGPNNDKIGIPLTGPISGLTAFEGTNTVRVTTLFGQKSDSIDVAVKKASTLTTFTLNAPTEVVSVGQTVKIPFTAVDQNGNALTKYSDLNGKINLYGTGALTLQQDFVTKNAYIQWVAGQEGPNYLQATVIGTPNTTQISINVEKAGYAESVAGLKDVNKNLAVGSSVTIEPKHIIVKDQHGRNVTLADILATYNVKLSAADGTANVLKPNVVDPLKPELLGTLKTGTTSLTLNAAVKGNERLKVELIKLGTAGAADTVVSTFENFTFSVIDNDSIKEYEVATIEKMHKAAGHEVEVKVTGKREDGTSVTLPTSAYTVAAANGLSYDQATNKLSAAGVTISNANSTVKAIYSVNILAANSNPIVKEVTVTNEDLVPTSFGQRDTTILKAADLVVKGLASNISVDNVLATVKVLDQFGVELTLVPGDFYASIAHTDNVAGNALAVTNQGGLVGTVSISGVDTGDSFSISFSSKISGKGITVKVVAVAAL